MNACTNCDHNNGIDALFCGRCGAQLEDIQTLPEGTMVGGERYRIDALLGVGGMGSVYKATDIGLQRTVALKLLNPELTAHPTARRRMLQEARILARIHHPNVVQVRSVFEEGSMLAMELEFIPGGDLLGAIPVGGMAEAEAVRIMKDVLSGLHALHEAGLVHRDVKPDNVLLAADGTAKVTDLGVARDATAKDKTRLGTVLGTAEYMSPEQIQGLPVDRRSDLYSVGILLYWILTGDSPYKASSEFEWQVAHTQHAPDMRRLHGNASPKTIAVVKRALAKQLERRFQDAAQMSSVLVGNGAVVEPPSPRRPAPRSAEPNVQAAAHSQVPRTVSIDLHVIVGPTAGAVYHLSGDSAMAGRGQDCDIVIADPSVSRRHFRLVRTANVVEVIDLGGVNFTQVNGARVSSRKLDAGDRLRVGNTVLELRVAGAEPTPAEPKRTQAQSTSRRSSSLPAPSGRARQNESISEAWLAVVMGAAGIALLGMAGALAWLMISP